MRTYTVSMTLSMLHSAMDTTVHTHAESSPAKRKINTYGERCMQSVGRWLNMTGKTHMAARLPNRTSELPRSTVECSDETLKKQKKK